MVICPSLVYGNYDISMLFKYRNVAMWNAEHCRHIDHILIMYLFVFAHSIVI